MRKLLGQTLIEAKLITNEQLVMALEIQKKEGNMLGVTLVKLGFIDDETLLDYLRDLGTRVRM